MAERDASELSRFRQARAVIEELLSLPDQDWESQAQERCGGDRELLAQVRRMIAERDSLVSILDRDGAGLRSLQPEPPADGPSAVWAEFIAQLRSRGPAHQRYLPRGEVGRGGMGLVRRVYDQDLRRELALKQVLGRRPTSHVARTDASLGRFLEEAQVTSQLDHPGIVPVHELGVDSEGQVYFTMKLVKGEDLAWAFEQVADPLDDEWTTTRAISVLQRACEALAYAHDKGVVHRDLKPANIMVGRYGETYVMDWGLARVLSAGDHRDLRIREPGPSTTTLIRSDRKQTSKPRSDSPLITMDGDVVGTPAYMSPEQAAGQLDLVGPQSDIYSMGAMIYQLLAGHMPYVPAGSRAHPYAILSRVRQGPPVPLARDAPQAPVELVAICEQAMARSIEDRYASMLKLARDLRAYLENRVVSAYESGLLAEFKKWVGRNKGLTATAAAALMVIAALTTWSVINIRWERNKALANERTALTERDRADQNATIAGRNAAEATARKAEFDQLAGVVLLKDTRTAEESLYPAWPEQADTLERWLTKDAARVLGLKPALRRTLSELETRALPRTDEGQESEQSSGPFDSREADPRRHGWRFETESQRFLHATLGDLERQIVAFEQNELRRVRQRLAWARRIEELTLRHPNALFTWEEAREAIQAADGVSASELYREQPIDLKPQWGLVPLGMNPVTMLWEFYHLRSAWDSASDREPAELPIPEHADDGSIEVRDGTGIVFVLIPGGTFRMGAQKTDPHRPNYDLLAAASEAPVRAIKMAPYFLARHELTKGQWFRLSGGEKPGWYRRGVRYDAQQPEVGWTHPVENVSWIMCTDLLRRTGLALPTEAQWERGARAGTTTAYWTGSEAATLAGAANVLDLRAEAENPGWGRQQGDFDDGYVNISPVGHYRDNPFGLFDVHGNVLEWCRDLYGGYATPARAGDGLRERPLNDDPRRVCRSGSLLNSAIFLRATKRDGNAPSGRSFIMGLRAARVLNP